ncbi:hypothetical protein AJ88_12100 [Mesorhizobium amorphae CCBAU 01583]|nr:hypothetical protein AJ88_12100 [Mesorhizobium amorphae CCBAU 01583]
MRDHCGAFLVIDIGELTEDRFLTEDVPFLPPFEIALASGDTAAEKAALKRFATAASGREAKYRTPRVDELNPTTRAEARLSEDLGDVAGLTVRFAPIYRVPGSERVYPELRDLVVANMVDSALQAVSAFLKASKLESPATHRSLGRRAYIDAVVRADGHSTASRRHSISCLPSRRSTPNQPGGNSRRVASSMSPHCSTGRSNSRSPPRSGSSIRSRSIIWKIRC